jgi:zinc/manganese transport system ATP-binding protein
MVDRVLYLAGGSFRIGTPDEVLRSEVLSELYGSPVDVIRTRGRVIVVGVPDAGHGHDGHHHHDDDPGGNGPGGSTSQAGGPRS